MNVAETLRNAFAENLGIDAAEIKDTSTLADMGADSLDEVEVLLEAEVRFGISITDEDWNACNTFTNYVALITRLVA